ncbi:MAG TPA: ABC transporter permease [Thermomicrobiales bacterium]|nr:ABC transporter permease [Thermomicrobiales bacterium]
MTSGTTAAVTPAVARPTLARRPKNRGQRVNGTLVTGVALLLIIILIAIIGPFVVPYTPEEFGMPLQPPSREHPFGTDNFGRDVATRVIYAAHLNLLIGIVPTAITFVVGIVVGSIAGYFGGKVDTVVMRIVDVVVAFPFIVLVIGIVAMLGPGLRNLFIGIALVGWVAYARLVRGEILVAKNQEYVLAAKTLGNGSARIIGRHILPNVVAPAVVFAMSDAVLNILLGAALSFLGLGVQPPTPEWGSMIQEARNFIRQAWWMPTFPGLAIIVTGIAFSVLGDGLAERLQSGR